MRNLEVIHNLETSTYEFVDDNNTVAIGANLQFRFIKSTIPVVFNQLRFGYNLMIDKVVVNNNTFPRFGEYSSSDQLHLEVCTINLLPNKEYELDIWVEESGNRTAANYTFITDIPPAPYPSWTWDNLKWVPPIPAPTQVDGSIYVWDEDTLSWIVLVELVDTSGYEVT